MNEPIKNEEKPERFPEGEFYDIEVPDTLDLVDNANYAIKCLVGTINKEWHELRKLTQHLLEPGNFKEVVVNTLDVKFEPEELLLIDKYSESIKHFKSR